MFVCFSFPPPPPLRILVHVSSKEMCLIETSCVSFESTQNKQQYDTKIAGIEVRKKLWCLEM